MMWLMSSLSLLLPTLLSDSQVLISLVIHGLWWTVSGQVKANVVLTCTKGLAQSPSCDCGKRQTINHIVDTCPLTKIWRWTESTPWSGWWRSHMTGIYSDCSTCEIIIIVFVSRAIDRSSAKVNMPQFITSLTGTLCNAVFATWSYA